MVFNLIKRAQSIVTNRFNGNTDFLEAVCAGSALMAMADGEASKEEIDLARKSLLANKTISEAFQPGDISRCMDKMLDIAEGGGRQAKARLLKQVADVKGKGDGEMADAVMYSVLDVADHGGVYEQEKEVAGKIADALGLTLSAYL